MTAHAAPVYIATVSDTAGVVATTVFQDSWIRLQRIA